MVWVIEVIVVLVIVYSINHTVYDVPLSPDCVAPHRVPDIPLLCPVTRTIFLLLPTYLVLYITIDSDVRLANLTTATITSAVVDIIMFLVIVHDNKKLILRPLNTK